ncbi:MAG: hypothetical protein AAF750_05590 [Planctomycetota bacterium]
MRQSNPCTPVLRIIAVALACAGLLFTIANTARAQLVIDPIAVQGQNTTGQTDPAAPNAAAPLPAFIKPGTRLIYAATAQQVDPNTRKPSTFGAKGFNVYDVVAVTPPHAHVLGRIYSPPPMQPNGPQRQTGLTPNFITLKQPTGDAALWMPKADLDAIQSSKDATSEIIVERGGTLQAAGQTFKTVVVAVNIRNQTSRTIYDADSGLMLSRVSQQADPNIPFTQRKRSGGSEQLVAIRQLSLPWLNTPTQAPAWLTPNATLRYQGQVQTRGAEMFQTTAASQITFTQTGPNWSSATSQLQLFINGQPHQNPTTSLHLDGPGNTLGLWKDPNTLAQLRPGVLDQDPVLNSKLSYDVQDGPQGRLGVFIEQDANDAHVRVYGYNLQTGVLTFQQIIDNTQGQTITATLAGQP